MDKLELITIKNSLVSTNEYMRIREFQLKNIVDLSDSNLDPTILKGMLKNIHDTDKWAEDFVREKKKMEGK